MKKDKRNPNYRISGQIAIAAIALSLGMIILGLTYIVSFMDIFIIIFVPFIAALVALRGDYRAELLFFFGTIAISFISWQEGFFQFLPNAMIGLAFGNVVKKFNTSFITYLATSVFSLIIEILLIFPINFIFEVDMINIYASIFGLTKETFLPIFPLFYLMLTSIQTLIMFITVSGELTKLGYLNKYRIRFNQPIVFAVLDAIFLSLSLTGHFLIPWLEYLSLGYVFLALGYQIFRVVYPFDKVNVILVSISIFLSIIISIAISSSFESLSDSPLGIVPGLALLSIVTVMLMYMHKPKQSDKKKKIDILKDL